MEPSAQELVVSIDCSTCGNQIRVGDVSCTSCKRQVTDDEIAALRRRWEASDPEAARRSDAVAYGRLSLLLVAGLSFLEAIIYGLVGESLPVLVFGVTIAATMIGLFLWGRREPLLAMVTGLSMYVLMQGIAAVATVWALTQGILIKIFVIASFTAGISAELHFRKQERNLSRRRAG